MKFEVF